MFYSFFFGDGCLLFMFTLVIQWLKSIGHRLNYGSSHWLKPNSSFDSLNIYVIYVNIYVCMRNRVVFLKFTWTIKLIYFLSSGFINWIFIFTPVNHYFVSFAKPHRLASLDLVILTNPLGYKLDFIKTILRNCVGSAHILNRIAFLRLSERSL